MQTTKQYTSRIAATAPNESSDIAADTTNTIPVIIPITLAVSMIAVFWI
jgi:hypothetical protein